MADVSLVPSLHISTALHLRTTGLERCRGVEMKARLSSGSEPRLTSQVWCKLVRHCGNLRSRFLCACAAPLRDEERFSWEGAALADPPRWEGTERPGPSPEVQERTEHPSQRGLRCIGTSPRTALVSPLQRSWRGGGGEDEPAHPNTRTPVVAHMFCPPLNPGGRGVGKPGFPDVIAGAGLCPPRRAHWRAVPPARRGRLSRWGRASRRGARGRRPSRPWDHSAAPSA